MDREVWLPLTGDARTSFLVLWPREGGDTAALQLAMRALAARQAAALTGQPPVIASNAANARDARDARDAGTAGTAGTAGHAKNAGLAGAGQDANALVEFVSSGAIRERSLRIFDRSFAVTYWLQAVAIGIGLFGVAASFSAQVLARRKEFGLLAHLGLTRRQILIVVAAEGAAWTSIGAVAGVLLGLVVSIVLVCVVNPQSFHWTMDLNVPGWRLLGLCVAVVASGTVTAWLAGRAAAGRDAVMAVKEDW